MRIDGTKWRSRSRSIKSSAASDEVQAHAILDNSPSSDEGSSARFDLPPSSYGPVRGNGPKQRDSLQSNHYAMVSVMVGDMVGDSWQPSCSMVSGICRSMEKVTLGVANDGAAPARNMHIGNDKDGPYARYVVTFPVQKPSRMTSTHGAYDVANAAQPATNAPSKTSKRVAGEQSRPSASHHKTRMFGCSFCNKPIHSYNLKKYDHVRWVCFENSPENSQKKSCYASLWELETGNEWVDDADYADKSEDKWSYADDQPQRTWTWTDWSEKCWGSTSWNGSGWSERSVNAQQWDRSTSSSWGAGSW
jgi:hypothetical protein